MTKSFPHQDHKTKNRKNSKVDCNHTNVANVVFHTTGIMLTNENICYLSGLCNWLRKIDEIKEKNFTEKMTNYFEEKKSTIWSYTMMEKIINL